MSEWRFTLRDLTEQPELLMPGHRACAGCGEGITVRQALRALRGPTIITNATGCLEVFTTIFPYSSWKLPWIHTAFENAAANAAGIEAALKAMKRKGRLKYDHVDIIAFAGDGGTYDIGLQALSGAVERGHDFLYILNDNEAYMNTGIQRSGSTPLGAWTTTSPAGTVIPGKREHKKPIADIIVAHGTPYVATATPAHYRDLITKVRKGLEVEGPAFLHLLAACPRGWRHETGDSIKISRLAVETCYFPVWEAVNGEFSLSTPSKLYALRPDRKKPVEEFLKPQGRFRHLFTPENRHVIDELQEEVDRRWEQLLKRCGTA